MSLSDQVFDANSLVAPEVWVNFPEGRNIESNTFFISKTPNLNGDEDSDQFENYTNWFIRSPTINWDNQTVHFVAICDTKFDEIEIDFEAPLGTMVPFFSDYVNKVLQMVREREPDLENQTIEGAVKRVVVEKIQEYDPNVPIKKSWKIDFFSSAMKDAPWIDNFKASEVTYFIPFLENFSLFDYNRAVDHYSRDYLRALTDDWATRNRDLASRLTVPRMVGEITGWYSGIDPQSKQEIDVRRGVIDDKGVSLFNNGASIDILSKLYSQAHNLAVEHVERILGLNLYHRDPRGSKRSALTDDGSARGSKTARSEAQIQRALEETGGDVQSAANMLLGSFIIS